MSRYSNYTIKDTPSAFRARVKSGRGFTIVELLIVIVVIAILAAITIVAYNGVQSRARDNIRKSDLAAITKLVEVRALEYSTYITSDTCQPHVGGDYADISGFFTVKGITKTGSNYGAKSAAGCLAEQAGASASFHDPSGEDSCTVGDSKCHVYMFSQCDGIFYVFAHLETDDSGSSKVDAVCGGGYHQNFRMNYYRQAAATS